MTKLEEIEKMFDEKFFDRVVGDRRPTLPPSVLQDKTMTLSQLTKEAESDFSSFMLAEYGTWKVGREETKSFLRSLIQNIATQTKEAMLVEKIIRGEKPLLWVMDESSDVEIGKYDDFHKICGYNTARSQMLANYEEFIKP